MNVEAQVFAERDCSSSVDYRTRTGQLATVLEQLWNFYEAMRLGKPLPDADTKLAGLKSAMRSVIKRA